MLPHGSGHAWDKEGIGRRREKRGRREGRIRSLGRMEEREVVTKTMATKVGEASWVNRRVGSARVFWRK